MGNTNSSKKFCTKDVKNKQLVIKMLKYEEQLTKSQFGQSLYANPLNTSLTSLHVEETLNRLTLTHFGFNTSDESVEMYRTIFKTYYRSPNDYDKDVIDSVHYMRENKCVFYTSKVINIGDVAPDCELYDYKTLSKLSLYNILSQGTTIYSIVAAFSLS